MVLVVGVNERDVLDETYRKAGKLDLDRFAINFFPESSGILDSIGSDLLKNTHVDDHIIRSELYKLNVYDMHCEW